MAKVLIDINDAQYRVEKVFLSVETPSQLVTAEKYGDLMMSWVGDQDLFKLLDKLSIMTEYVEIKLNGDKNVQ